jgi:YidC/Oxa1 family membrane protein insertase
VNLFGEIGFLFSQIFMRPIFNGLMLLYHLFGDFGLSIVVLTLIIKLLLFPLTLKQLKSMKANQQLQPQIQELRKKYAKDQQAQVQALQALYKEYGVSPLTGCLPMVVQLPVLYGLYYALYSVVNAEKAHSLRDLNNLLYQPFVEPFRHLPSLDLTWFQWLSFLNPILHVHWSWTLSLVQPDPSHILPVLAALATFISLRISQPKTAPVVSNNNNKSGQPDPTAQTMKTMQFVMPFFILFIGWNFTSGLVLYWIISSVFQAVQQYFVTGWGSLLTVPNLMPKNGGSAFSSNGAVSTTTNTGESVREKTGAQRTKQAENEDDEDEKEGARSGSVASKVRSGTTSQSKTNGNYSSSRRQRGGSASARRRGGSQRSRR